MNGRLTAGPSGQPTALRAHVSCATRFSEQPASVETYFKGTLTLSPGVWIGLRSSLDWYRDPGVNPMLGS